MIGFVMMAHVSFSPYLKKLSTMIEALHYCFSFILGEFDFRSLQEADRSMAWLFFFPYITLFYCVLMNIFFAIVDRFFITAEPEPINLKKNLRPIIGRFFTCINWEEDFLVNDQNPKRRPKQRPDTRKAKVEKALAECRQIVRRFEKKDGLHHAVKEAKQLDDVCETGTEVGERMQEALTWSSEQA